MSYKRMKSEEARLMAEVKALLRQAEATDEREDAEYGATRRGDELSEELAFRESRLKKIREARAELEREAREEAEKRRREIDDRKSSGPRRGRPPKAPDETPAPKDQKNFTDPESRIMPASGEKKSFIHGYNCQAAVDQSSQVIVAAEVTQDTNDKKQGVPLIEQVLTNMEKIPVHVSMDAGYFSEETIGAIESLGIEAFIPPDRQKHTKPPPPAPRGRIPKSLGVADRMRRKLQTKRGRAIYEKRKETVEPVFGQIKQARGIRQFLLRGVIKVKAEWMLICTGHNLLKLWKAIPSG